MRTPPQASNVGRRQPGPRKPPSLEPGPTNVRRTQDHPFFPGQKPARIQTRYRPRGGVAKRTPVYERRAAGPAGDDAAQLSSAQVAAARLAGVQTPLAGRLFTGALETLAEFVPGEVAAKKAARGGHVGALDVGRTAFDAATFISPAHLAAGTVGIGAKFAAVARDGRTLREAALAASTGRARRVADSPRLRTIRRDVMPALRQDPARSFVHSQIDAQLPPEKAAIVKRELDLDALHHADSESKALKGGSLKQRRQAQASSFYENIVHHSANNNAAHPIPGGFARSTDKADANLRQFLNPKNLDKGGVQNAKVLSRHPELSAHPVVGKITPEEHLARTSAAVGNDAETAIRLANWYRELGPMFEHFFGDDAPAIIRGFAVSQANDSPAGGLAAVLKLRDKMMRGEYIRPGEASVVSDSIQQAIRGEHVSKGLAAKLHDFVDSLEGKRTRTWVGDDIRGGSPTAIDIHAQRDLGRIDPKILTTLRERHGLPVAHLQLEVLERELARVTNSEGATVRVAGKAVPKAEAVAKQRAKIKAFQADNADAIAEGKQSGLVLDNPQASATGASYSNALREYQEATDHYNQVGAFGKTDWTPAEVQALGWSGIQRFHGVVPEDATSAINANTHHLSFETLNGMNGFNEAPAAYREALALTKSSQSRVIQIAETEGTFVRDITFGPGGYENTITPSMQIQVIGSSDQADRIAQQLANEFQQWEVWATRPGIQGARSRFAIEFTSPAFGDENEVRRFWEALQEHATPKQREQLKGFAPFQFVDESGDTVHGIRVITMHRSAKRELIEERLGTYRETIDAAVADLPYNVESVPNNVEVRIHDGEAHSEADAAAGSSGELAADPGDAAALHPALHPAFDPGAGAELPAVVAARSLWEHLKSEEGSIDLGKIFRRNDDTLAQTSAPLGAGTPEEQVVEGLKGARSVYGRQKVLRAAEAKRRSEAVDRALRSIEDPDEARAAAADAMRGEMPTIEFNGLTQLDADALRQMKQHVNQRDDLLPFQKLHLNDALDKATLHGRVPTPSEMRLIEHVFGKKNAIGVASHAASGWDKLINALNIPRSLMATADLSAVGRQALVAGAAHPVLWGKSWPTMLKSMRRPEEFERRMQKIKDDDLYPLALAAKVSFTDIGEDASLLAHEEQFASEYATHIPGIGRVIKASARAYVGFLNEIRMALFKHQIRIAVRAGRNVQDEEFLTDIGKVINASTGRGSMWESAEHMMPALNTFLFSPRLMLSRINYLDPTWYVRLSKPARIEALRGLFATAGAVTGGLIMLSRIPGVEVGSLDPRSSDFGKLRIGDTRIDLGGGFQQYVRLAAELIDGHSVSTTTGEVHKLGEGITPTKLEVAQNFVYNKFAPAPGMALDALRGTDAVGNPVTVESTLVGHFSPLLWQDSKDLYRERHGGVDGLTWALGGYAIGGLGVGLSTYSAKPSKGKPPPRLRVGGSSGGSDPFGGSSGGSPWP